jgi:hypothetical protein
LVILAVLVKNGTHGTSAINAKVIREKGFLVRSGRAGRGVYFWAESAYNRQLAIAWFQQCRAEGRYGAQKEGAVIYAALKADEEEILNLEAPDIANRVSVAIHLRGTRYWTDPKVAALWDGFIKEMEKNVGRVFRVIVARLAPPSDRFCSYPMRLLGAPFCYIVRILDSICEIKVEEIRE